MIKLVELDPSTSFMSQLQEKTGPIVLVNTFVVPEGRMDEVLAAWQQDAAYMKSCPGFISTQMHRATGAGNSLVNVAVWESTEALHRAFSTPEFQQTTKNYPEGTVACPHVFEKVAVDGICVA